ncbi:GIY-YIG nuclease family protein [Bacteroidota bacterium]
MFFAYILKSEIVGSHYYGHCTDLNMRLKRHNGGKVRSTKSKRPWRLLYYEEFPTRSEAYKRELFFKSRNGYKFLKEKEII